MPYAPYCPTIPTPEEEKALDDFVASLTDEERKKMKSDLEAAMDQCWKDFNELPLLAHRASHKFNSEYFSMQCDWDRLPFYKKWYFHICKFFGVWYDWNKGKYM